MKSQCGYTLLEMVVVIGLLALASALVAPAGYRLTRSWQESDELKQVVRTLSRLATETRQAGKPVRLGAGSYDGSLAALTVPEGWEITFFDELTVRANGACSGARGQIDSPSRSLRFVMTPPYCRVELQDGDSL